MSNLTRIPLIDNYRTNLSQEWNGATGTVYVATTPTFTFPSGITTYIVVNPGKTNMQIAEINSYNSTNKTVNVSNITLEKGASVNSTAQTHTVGSEVIISDNYQFWLDILTAINSKIDTLTGLLSVYADATARNTAIPTPSNGMQVYITSEGKFYDYTAGSWTARESGGTFANASTTVAGKVEIATDAEITAGTGTGGTGALLVPTPTQIKKSISLKNAGTTFSDTDEIVVNISGEDKRITGANLRDSIPASATQKGTVEMATDAEASTGTDETRYVNSKQIKLVTTGFTTVTGTSGDTSVFTATKPGYLNFYIGANHVDNQIGGVTSYIAYSTDGGSTYTTINTVTNNSSGGSGTASTVEWRGVWHYNIGMKIKGNVTVTSSGSGLVRFDYSN